MNGPHSFGTSLRILLLLLLCALAPTVRLRAQSLVHQWSKVLGPVTAMNQVCCRGNIWLQMDDQGNSYWFGTAVHTADMDPGSGTALLYGCGTCEDGNGFVAKYDPSGNYLWHIELVNTFRMDIHDLDVDLDSGFVAIVGEIRGWTDFDPGPGTVVSNPSSTRGFVAVYDLGDGHYIERMLYNGGIADAYAVLFDQDHRLVVGGNIFLTVDIDPGPGTVNYNGNYTPFFARYDLPFALHSYHFFEDGTGWIYDMENVPSGGIVVVGELEGFSVDLDPGPAHSSTNAGAIDEGSFMARYAADGSYLWNMCIRSGSLASSTAFKVQVDADENYTLGGLFNYGIGANTPLDLDPGPGVYELPELEGDHHRYVAQYDAAGAIKWAYGLRHNIYEPYSNGAFHAANGWVFSSAVTEFSPDHDEPVMFLHDSVLYDPPNCAAYGTQAYITGINNAGDLLFVEDQGDSLYCHPVQSAVLDVDGNNAGDLLVLHYYYGDSFYPAYEPGTLMLDTSTAGHFVLSKYSMMPVLPTAVEPTAEPADVYNPWVQTRLFDAMGREVPLPFRTPITESGAIAALSEYDLRAGVYLLVGVDAKGVRHARRVQLGVR